MHAVKIKIKIILSILSRNTNHKLSLQRCATVASLQLSDMFIKNFLWLRWIYRYTRVQKCTLLFAK